MFQHLAVDGRHTSGQIKNIQEHPVDAAFLQNIFDDVLTHPLNGTHPHANRVLIGHREEPITHVDVRRQENHPAFLSVIDEYAHLFALIHHETQVPRKKRSRVMDFEVSRLPRHKRIGGGVRLIEAVPRKFFHQVEDVGRGLFVHITLSGPFDEHRALSFHLFDVLFTHGAAQQVGAPQRVAPDRPRHQHHLFLIHHDAVGFAQNRFHTLIEVLHLFAPELTINKVRNLIHRARTVQSV